MDMLIIYQVKESDIRPDRNMYTGYTSFGSDFVPNHPGAIYTVWHESNSLKTYEFDKISALYNCCVGTRGNTLYYIMSREEPIALGELTYSPRTIHLLGFDCLLVRTGQDISIYGIIHE